ncbi:hypothetical protein COLO4_21632 [Corchorus olitorius]|uniref:F-box domain-containing protein n=1 Tax=Corchorus olitorius TaxID=93759 RepID=A0A1R3IS56_9ROSI|nr:hypothetical protein COLO4_21632 [Corchorus olitorius]
MENTNSYQPRLPDAIVDDILLCLPAKSLLRFKLVSKPWNSLISTPNFAESHLNRTNTIISQGKRSANLLRLGQMSILERDRRQGHPPSLSLDSMDADGSNREVVTIDLGRDTNYSRDSILGSCNGLLLVQSGREDYFLLNPSTRKYKKIAPLRHFLHLNDEARFISGLAYESTSRNYKGIIVSHDISGGTSSPHRAYPMQYVSFNIYDDNLQNWKSKGYGEFHPYRLCSSDSAVMVNGIPHWCVCRRHEGARDENDEFGQIRFRVNYVIVYVDLKTEKVKEVGLPEWALTEVKFNLGVLGGCLCMSLHPQGSSTSIQVWAMKVYGIAESWTKLFVIESSFFRELRPLCFIGTGKNQVLMQESGGRLTIFNLKEETEQMLAFFQSVWTYHVESLVLPGRRSWKRS